MNITLDSPISINVQTAPEVYTSDSIQIRNIDDNYNSVRANITFGKRIMSLILWDGQDYINIGQYTDTDIKNRIIELLNAMK